MFLTFNAVLRSSCLGVGLIPLSDGWSSHRHFETLKFTSVTHATHAFTFCSPSTLENSNQTNRNPSTENYKLFQGVSHFAYQCDGSTNKQTILDAVNNLYVAETNPLRVTLGDEIRTDIKEVIELFTILLLTSTVRW